MAIRLSQFPAYACDQCGACCRRSIIEADHLDALREPRIATEAHLMSGNGKLPLEESVWSLMDPGHPTHGCIFLGDDNLCTIYNTRPNCCVNCQAGSDRCQASRFSEGLPPLAPAKATSETVMEQIAALAREPEAGR